MLSVEVDDGRYLASSMLYRGGSGSAGKAEADSALESHQEQHPDRYVDWIPDQNLGMAMNKMSSSEVPSCTMVANTTATKGVFQRLATQFGAMYRRKAFLHWYKGEGMDEMEFQEADKNVRDLITEYQDKQDATYEPESGSEGDEDDDI